MSVKTFEDMDSLAIFMNANPGVWESQDDVMARTLGWKNETSGQIVTIPLTKVVTGYYSSKYAFGKLKTPEERKNFAKRYSDPDYKIPLKVKK